ncbi:receptor-binding cancer antigen expressed on SiSo cells [Taeniopygia guttata]|uniref:Putative estrogen receptor binding site associated antigen 9 variant 2 n=1 Tax=Taeniopygia guttata TaxID=59729 RepID=B5G1L2_TAEGU|nr:receptor-binding cancer antigen expressed on SiSo cells [Taeniopygia guttata]ACH45173.1 putative estrogen receptor binding site associated antigen 9 variant 2 [Taeniopygia guttata]
MAITQFRLFKVCTCLAAVFSFIKKLICSAHVFRAWRNPTFFFQVWKRAKVKWRPNNFANHSGLFICS